MNPIKVVCIYCGSSKGRDPLFSETAHNLGQYLASKEISIIYGGAQVGLMGSLANGSLTYGGEVIGILPSFLSIKEIAHDNLTETIMTDNMHQRKQMMFEKSDAFIILPGGFGTLDEMFEILTWGQLGLHTKPIGVLNINGYYDHLLAFLDNIVYQGLMNQRNRDMLISASDIDSLMDMLYKFTPMSGEKWVK
jgi:uncharacterized protein (TIGR00730 family)